MDRPAQNEIRETRSLASVYLTSLFIAINHFYVLGPNALLLGGFIAVSAAALMFWFRRRQSKVAIAGYMLLSLWVVVGFGFYKGLWNGILRLFLQTWLAGLSTAYAKPFIGTFAYEAAGILMFVGGLFVAYYALQLTIDIRARAGSEPASSATNGIRWLTVPGAVAGLVLIAAYVVTKRDRFVPPPNGVVTIGVIAPTTGPYSILGNSFVKAVEMARNDLKGTRYTYRLKITDSGPDPSKARDIVSDVVERDKVNAVIGAVSLIGAVTKPYATKARIVHTCICTVTSIGDGGYNFTNIPSPQAEAVRWVGEARRRGIKRIAVVSQDYPSINNHVKAMKAEALREGLVISYEYRFADTVKDFRDKLVDAQASRPDVFYVEALEPNLDILGQQLVDARIRNIASVVAPSLSERPVLFEGAWYTDSDLADMEFKSRFEARYPGTQFATHMMPYAYDSFNMIVQAYERRENPAAYIRGITSYVGQAGAVVKAPGSGNFQSKPAVWMISNGRPVLLNSAGTPNSIAAR
jgi:ABC-type branched-subunit amino acid transport system substrate-binding protein